MKKFVLCVCVCGIETLSATSFVGKLWHSEDIKFGKWRHSIEGEQNPYESADDLTEKQMDSLNKSVRENSAETGNSHHSFWSKAKTENSDFSFPLEAESYKKLVEQYRAGVCRKCVDTLRDSLNYAGYVGKEKEDFFMLLRRFWNVGRKCKNGKAGPCQKSLKKIWWNDGHKLFYLHEMREDFRGPWTSFFLEWFKNKDRLWLEKKGNEEPSGRGDSKEDVPLPNDNQLEVEHEKLSDLPDGEFHQQEISSDLNSAGDHQNENQLTVGDDKVGYVDFLTNVSLALFDKKVGCVESAADFAKKQRFRGDVIQLVEVTREFYFSPQPAQENGIQRFLREKSLDRYANCGYQEKMDKFFSHFGDGLIGDLYGNFANWGSSSKLKVILLHGKTGTGKTESFQWLFGNKDDKSVSVIKAKPGNSLVGDEDSPGILDILLMSNSYWRCIDLVDELSSARNLSLEDLVSRLKLQNGEVWFRSPYFGKSVPVKNVVIACTSNSENPGDDGYLTTSDCVDYGKVQYGAFDGEYVRKKVGSTYEKEFKKRFPEKGKEMWEKIRDSELSSLEGEIFCLREIFERQVEQCNLGDMADQKVAAFIAEGGEAEYLRWNSSK